MSERTGYNSVRTKNRNRGIVLRLIAGKQLSRADITKKIGLTKMAITKIVGELIEDGYIVEGKGESAPGVGRAPTFLEISAQSPVSLGLYISRNELAVIACPSSRNTPRVSWKAVSSTIFSSSCWNSVPALRSWAAKSASRLTRSISSWTWCFTTGSCAALSSST